MQRLQRSMVASMESAQADVAETERTVMSDPVVEKTWEIAAHGGKGPVTITLRMPEVKITDSEGRYIVISPGQADIVSSRMEDIACWMEEGPSE